MDCPIENDDFLQLCESLPEGIISAQCGEWRRIPVLTQLISAQNLAKLCHEALTDQHWLLCGFGAEESVHSPYTGLINEKYYSQYAGRHDLLPLDSRYYPGWWVGTFFIFPYIGDNNPNWLIFFRGAETTNQYQYIGYFLGARSFLRPPALFSSSWHRRRLLLRSLWRFQRRRFHRAWGLGQWCRSSLWITRVAWINLGKL